MVFHPQRPLLKFPDWQALLRMPGSRITRKEFLKLAGAAGIGALAASYPFLIERYWIQTNLYRIRLPNLPRAFHGLRIVHLSDLHFGPLVPRLVMEYVVWQTNRLRRDLVVLTGDYVHTRNTTREIDGVWPMLSRLQAPLGVYAVLGNHDHWADLDRSLYWLERSGQGLRHRAVALERQGQRLWLGGAGDLWEDDLGIDQAFSVAPDQECKILLSHNPDSADEPYQARVDLILSGHTHGGQVKLPFLGALKLPVSNRGYVDGLLQARRSQLFISRGIGWAIVPVRFNCPPEIAVLELYAA